MEIVADYLCGDQRAKPSSEEACEGKPCKVRYDPWLKFQRIYSRISLYAPKLSVSVLHLIEYVTYFLANLGNWHMDELHGSTAGWGESRQLY